MRIFCGFGLLALLNVKVELFSKSWS